MTTTSFIMEWLLGWFQQQYMNQFKIADQQQQHQYATTISSFSSNLISYGLFQSGNNNNSTAEPSIQVNGTRCHPILFNLGGLSMEPVNPKFEYGICPDTIFTPLVTSITLTFSTCFLIAGLIGIFVKRNSGHIKARNPILMVSTLFASFSFVLISTMRYLVGRKVFPCALFALTFFIIVPLVMIPNMLRSIRLYCLFKLNMIKVGNRRLSLASSSSNINTTTTNKFLNLSNNKNQQQTPTDVASTSTTAGTPTTATNSTVDQQQQTATTTTTASTPTTTEDGLLPAANTTPRSVKFQEEAAVVKQSSTGVVLDPVEPYDSWNEVTDIDILSDIASDYSPHMMEESDLRNIKILTFLSSNKFIALTYGVLIPLHLALWLVLGGIEEGIYQRDPTQKRVILDDGGLLMFSQGCITNFKTVIIIVVQAALYIVGELTLLFLCLFADRDTWKIKIETFVVVVVQFTFTVMFGCEQISVIYTLIEFVFPSGNVMATATVVEVFVSVMLPLIYSIVRDHRMKQYKGASDLEKLLRNKKMFVKLLEFSRKSYCPENILCFKDIQIYRRMKQPGKRRMAVHICNNYLRQYAPLELNMPLNETRFDEIMGRIDRKETLEKNLFDYLDIVCLNNMQDVFERLKESDRSVKDFIEETKPTQTSTGKDE